jgi:hypothetical protein
MTEQCSCEELNRKLDQLIEQTRSGSAMKGKRAPSEWQKYLKNCMPQKTGSFPERIKACSVDYKRK